jgi:hypothetical protein
MSDYFLFVPKQAVGANLVYFDLFNNYSAAGPSLHINHVNPVVSGAVAVTGVVGVDLFLTFTSAIGTGGTAATRTGTDLTACTFGYNNPKPTYLPGAITARLTPSGGATAAGIVSWLCVFSEETNAGTYTAPLLQFLNPKDCIVVPPGTGIRVVQGAVASVGNIGFNVGFNLVN